MLKHSVSVYISNIKELFSHLYRGRNQLILVENFKLCSQCQEHDLTCNET